MLPALWFIFCLPGENADSLRTGFSSSVFFADVSPARGDSIWNTVGAQEMFRDTTESTAHPSCGLRGSYPHPVIGEKTEAGVSFTPTASNWETPVYSHHVPARGQASPRPGASVSLTGGLWAPKLQAPRGLTAAHIGGGGSCELVWDKHALCLAHAPWADERRRWRCGQRQDSKSRLGFPGPLVRHLKLPHPHLPAPAISIFSCCPV